MTRPLDPPMACWSRFMTLGLLTALVGGGCNVAAFLGQAFPQKTKALYVLPDRPTLVLVDDPANLMGDPTLPSLISANIGAALVREKKLTTVVDSRELDALLVTLGDQYNRMPIDWVGRKVHADQVIYVQVVSATLYPSPGLLQPTANVEVKVIDALKSQRLFPVAPGEQGDPQFSLTPRGYGVESRLVVRGGGAETTAARVLAQQLAERMARDVARLFHDYLPRQPGQPYD